MSIKFQPVVKEVQVVESKVTQFVSRVKANWVFLVVSFVAGAVVGHIV